MEQTKQKPTIGRVVHFWKSPLDADGSHGPCDPQAAIIIGVHDEHRVDLTVFTTEGSVTKAAVIGNRQVSVGECEQPFWTWPTRN